MLTNLALLPVLIPLFSGILTLLMWKRVYAQRIVTLAGTGCLLIASVVLLLKVLEDGIQVVQPGGWPAPFGISIVADLLSAIMVIMAAMKGFGVAIYSLSSMDSRREAFGYYPLLNFLLMGVCGAFLTGDMFNLYVWFEVMLIASFVLLALGGERAQLEGAIKYVTINLVSSAIFLAAVGTLYGFAGTLNMAELSVLLKESDSGMIDILAMLFLISFGIKAAIFPLFFWLPASYHTTPVAVSAIFAGLLTKVGVYAIIRVFTLLFTHDVEFTHTLILILAGFTMVTGVLGAAAQPEFRRTLSFHIISQIGYMLMGLALFTPLALAGSIFYIVHHMIVKTNLFLISGVVYRLKGSYEFKKLGSVYRDHPGLSFLFLVSALSLAGVPPLSGFWGKFILIKAGLEIEAYIIAVVALLVGLFTLFSMTKVWAEVFWKEQPEDKSMIAERRELSRTGRPLFVLYIPIVAFAACTLCIGIFVEPLFAIAVLAAEQLLDPAQYITAVLPGREF